MKNLKTKYPKLYAEWQLSKLSINDYIALNNVYISTYPHTHHKHGMFYASVVQCFSQVYYSYYELQDDDTYEWKTTTVHHTEFERTEKQISRATYEQAMEQAMQMAFALLHNDNF
jgi:hypothetical protein